MKLEWNVCRCLCVVIVDDGDVVGVDKRKEGGRKRKRD